MPYITINVDTMTVEQVRDSYADAQRAADCEGCIVAVSQEMGASVRPGQSVRVYLIPNRKS